MSATIRREALRRAALAGGALTALGLPALVRAPLAAAQTDPADEDLRDFLEAAIEEAQTGVLAYEGASAAKPVKGQTRRLFDHFRDQEEAHATALRSALDSLGFDPPDPPSGPDAVPELRPLARIKSERDALELLIELTANQLRLYLDQGAALEATDMLRTCLEIAANEAQHLVVLREALGADPSAAVELPRGKGDGEGAD